MINKTMFILLFTAAFISCSPEIKHPDLEVIKSDKWLDSAQTYAYIDSAWWGAFGDEKLDSVIASAFKYNYSLQAAAARIEAAEAQATIAGADLYPALSVGGSGSRSKRSSVGFPFEIPVIPALKKIQSDLWVS